MYVLVSLGLAQVCHSSRGVCCCSFRLFPLVSACFRLFPFVSVCFRLFPLRFRLFPFVSACFRLFPLPFWLQFPLVSARFRLFPAACVLHAYATMMSSQVAMEGGGLSRRSCTRLYGISDCVSLLFWASTLSAW